MPSLAGLRPRSDSENRPLYGSDGALVERLDNEETWLRDREGCQLLERRLGAVVVDVDAMEDLRVGTSRADGAELPGHVVEGLVHAEFRVLEELLDHVAPFLSEPTCRQAPRSLPG